MPRSEKLKAMVRQGIPHSIRPQIWMRISGAQEKKLKASTTYKDVVRTSSNDHLMTSKQIEKVGIVQFRISVFYNLCSGVKNLLPFLIFSFSIFFYTIFVNRKVTYTPLFLITLEKDFEQIFSREIFQSFTTTSAWIDENLF